MPSAVGDLRVLCGARTKRSRGACVGASGRAACKTGSRRFSGISRAQGLQAIASISILVPAMFVACKVDRDGLFPGKNSLWTRLNSATSRASSSQTVVFTTSPRVHPASACRSPAREPWHSAMRASSAARSYWRAAARDAARTRAVGTRYVRYGACAVRAAQRCRERARRPAHVSTSGILRARTRPSSANCLRRRRAGRRAVQKRAEHRQNPR